MWHFFDKVNRAADDDKIDIVQCKICKVRKRQKDGNTTNMRAHMNKCHAKEYAQFEISSVHSGMQSFDDSDVDDEGNAASGSGSGSLQGSKSNERSVSIYNVKVI